MRSTSASLAALVLLAASAPLSRVQSQERTLASVPFGLSVGGDFVAELSHRGPTLRDSSRFVVREIDVGARHMLGRWRGELRLRTADRQGVTLAEAYLSGALIGGFRGRIGRFHLPFGDLNELHRHLLPTVEAPYAHQRFVGDVSTAASGVALQRALFRDRFEVTGAVVDALTPSAGTALDNPQESFSGLGYLFRTRGRWTVKGATLATAVSGMTGRRLQPLSDPVGAGERRIDAVVARQSVVGLETVLSGGAAASTHSHRWLTAPWSFSAQLLYQFNEPESSLRDRIPANAATGGPFYEGPDRDVLGGSLTIRVPVFPRWSLTARGDRLSEPFSTLGMTQAVSGSLEWTASNDVQVAGMYELRSQTGRSELHRLFLRARFALGEPRERGF